MAKLYVLIGGSDEQNGDYSFVHRLARNGRTTNWSSLKDAQPRDRALIYIQRPHSAIIARAAILGRPAKTQPNDPYLYRAKTGRFELLPAPVTISDLRQAFPKWAWLRYPRRGALVPPQYAKPLWELAQRKERPTTYIIPTNAEYGRARLEELAATGRSSKWMAPKFAKRGDTAVFYVAQPASAIFATAKILAPANSVGNGEYEARVGEVRLLGAPIALAELRELFPDWEWLGRASGYVYVDPKRAAALLGRCTADPSKLQRKIAVTGGGFGDAKTNALVERAAIGKVIRILKRRGFSVISREADRIGYDLDATKRGTELHVEVKGTSGKDVQFLVTRREAEKAATDRQFRLFVVTAARTTNFKIFEFHGRELAQKFSLTATQYVARRK